MKNYSVQETNAGQIFITLPRKLADAMNISKGSEVKFEVAGKNKLMLEVKK
jgi:antitoxin component of MazEF toxin-antitoxin module